jgi:hypothetical protein
VICLVTGLYPKPILQTVDAAIQPILAPAHAVIQREHGPAQPELVVYPSHWPEVRRYVSPDVFEEPASP